MAKIQPEVKTTVQAVIGDQAETFRNIQAHTETKVPVVDGCAAIVLSLVLNDGTKKTIVALVEQPVDSGDPPLIADQIIMTQTEPISKAEAVFDDG
jgi:hypothetical protein